MFYTRCNNSILNKIVVIIIFSISSNFIQTCLKCCDEQSVNIRKEPRYIIELTNLTLLNQNSPIRNSILTRQANNDTTHSIITTFTTILATGLANPFNSSTKQISTPKQLIPTTQSIFSSLNLETLKNFFLDIDGIVYDQYAVGKFSLEPKGKDNSNFGEYLYLENKKYHDFFKENLRFIFEKFIKYIYQNLNAPDIQKLATEQIELLDNFLSPFDNLVQHNSHRIFTKWLKQITKDEIREKNITLEYMPNYIKEFIISTIPPQDFQKEHLSEYKKLLLEKVMAPDAKAEELFNKKITIQKLLQKNGSFINILEDIFTDLFLEKVRLMEAKPSAEAENCMPHMVND